MLSEFLLADMARHTALPLNRQLYEAMRRAMLDGKLAAGERLPSSRDMAQDLGVSRNTVMAAIGQLTVEGYLSSHVGSGTYVADTVSTLALGHAQPNDGTTAQALRSARTAHAARTARSLVPDPLPLSNRGEALAHRFNATDLEVQPFAPGPADFGAFPVNLWQRLQNRHWRQTRADMLDYSATGGYGPLRRAVADYLRVFRSVQLEPDQVLITSGTQQSLELCAQLLADPGDTVWVEDPAYWGAAKAFLATSLAMHPVAVDGEGICPTPADHAHPPRFLYVTPSHQYPTGAVMSLPRRHQVLQAARQHNAWVLEDDYDSEFRFSGPPVSSLQGLDADGRVLYMGTFSKVLYPGLKLGYLVVPQARVAEFRQAHYDLNRPGQLTQQAALAEFIEMGHFASTLRRARQAYAERRKALVAALQPVLHSGLGWISGAEQGLHLCLRLVPKPDGTPVDDRALAHTLAQQGLTVRPLSAYCLKRQDLRGLVIGYGYASLAQIAHHGPRLADLLQLELKKHTP
ncbi:aminotransferase-like domain-containing protein [Hydrogenophaga soli]